MVLITAERAKPQPCLLSSSQTFTLTSDPQPCPCPVLGLGAVWVSLAALLTSLLCNRPLLSVPTPTLPGLQGTERAPPVSPDPPHRAHEDLLSEHSGQTHLPRWDTPPCSPCLPEPSYDLSPRTTRKSGLHRQPKLTSTQGSITAAHTPGGAGPPPG